jgi:hypothetical protein
LKSRLLTLVQEAHNHALTNYHSTSQVDIGKLSTSPFIEPQCSGVESSSTPALNSTSEGVFGTIYQPTPEDVDAEGQHRGSDDGMKLKNAQHHSSFDSGYFTDFGGTDSSQQTAGETPAHTSIVGELERSGDVDNSMQMQKTGPIDSLHDEVWLFQPAIMTMDDPLNFHAFET